MEGSEVVNGVENGGSSEGRPLNPLAVMYRQCFGGGRVTARLCKKSVVRHHSLVVKTKTTGIAIEPRLSSEDHGTEFIPILRSYSSLRSVVRQWISLEYGGCICLSGQFYA